MKYYFKMNFFFATYLLIKQKRIIKLILKNGRISLRQTTCRLNTKPATPDHIHADQQLSHTPPKPHTLHTKITTKEGSPIENLGPLQLKLKANRPLHFRLHHRRKRRIPKCGSMISSEPTETYWHTLIHASDLVFSI
jgi:hypothetical protein